jgi:hypothetical protein
MSWPDCSDFRESTVNTFFEPRLAPARFTSVKVDMDLSQVALTSGQEPDYVPDRLAEMVDTDPINELLVSIYLERAGEFKMPSIFLKKF